jgi:hypothetical protein
VERANGRKTGNCDSATSPLHWQKLHKKQQMRLKGEQRPLKMTAAQGHEKRWVADSSKSTRKAQNRHQQQQRPCQKALRPEPPWAWALAARANAPRRAIKTNIPLRLL